VELEAHRGESGIQMTDDLSRFSCKAEGEGIVITCNGKPAGLLISFGSEDDWRDYRLKNDPRFLRCIEPARKSLGGRSAVSESRISSESASRKPWVNCHRLIWRSGHYRIVNNPCRQGVSLIGQQTYLCCPKQSPLSGSMLDIARHLWPEHRHPTSQNAL
jgi:hypothetical protein